MALPSQRMADAEHPLPPNVQEAVNRMVAEYREMPGMTLTVTQAQRLWGIDTSTCTLALGALMRRRFLKRGANGAYFRAWAG